MSFLDFIEFNFISIIDIVLVAVLMYQLYKLVRGTVAINIFIGLTSIYLLWKLVDAMHMELLSEILGQFIGVGVIILVIVFQQELRKFLIMIGRAKLIKNQGFFKFNIGEQENKLDVSTLSKACQDLSKSKTGALLVITHTDDLAFEDKDDPNSPDFNWTLSAQRAAAAARFLIEVDPEYRCRVVAMGFGPSRPREPVDIRVDDQVLVGLRRR